MNCLKNWKPLVLVLERRWQFLFRVYADFLKDKFSGSFCHVFTVILLSLCFSFSLVLKLVLIVEFSTSFHIGFPWGLPFFLFMCVIVFIVFSPYYHQLLFSPLFPPPSVYLSQLYSPFHVLEYIKYNKNKFEDDNGSRAVFDDLDCFRSQGWDNVIIFDQVIKMINMMWYGWQVISCKMSKTRFRSTTFKIWPLHNL